MIITGGEYKGRKIQVPDENITRPTLSKAREAIFSVLFSLIDFEEKNFLDMFAGSGIMGLEALSRGFKNVLGIEKHPKAFKVAKENYEALKLNPNIVLGDSLKILKKQNEKFDVIYIDPPYLSGIYENCLKIIKEDSLLKDGGVVVLEHVVEIPFEELGFSLLKQKSYSKKLITFLELK